jgi:hypothetical protein
VAKEQLANNLVLATVGSLDTTQTTVTLATIAGAPTPPFQIKIDSEIMRVTAKGGSTYTVARGQEGTTAATHNTAAPVYHPLTVAGLQGWNAQLLGGTEVCRRRGLNFIASGTATVALAEDAGNENCNVTIGGLSPVLASGHVAFTLNNPTTGITFDADLTGVDFRGRTVLSVTPIVRISVTPDGTISSARGDFWTITNAWMYRLDGLTTGPPEHLHVGANLLGGTYTDGVSLHLYYSLLAQS